MEKIYWTMKNGQKINVDDMNEQHLRNTLKMVLKNIRNAKAKAIAESKTKLRFVIHGEIAQDHIDQGYLQEQEEDYPDYWHH